MFNIEIYNYTRYKVPKKIFSDLLENVEKWLIKEKKIKKGQVFTVEVSFVGNKRMQMLNKEFRGRDCPTDVLSFGCSCKSESDNFAGEIFINLSCAKQQAEVMDQPLPEEIRFLFVHGILHIFGYDHVKAKDEKTMKEISYRILGRR